MTLDTPLFSHRINFVDSELVVTDPEPYCVAYLRVNKAELVPKSDWVPPTVAQLRETLGLDDWEEAEGLDEQGCELLGRVNGMEVTKGQDFSVPHTSGAARRGPCFGRRGHWFTVMAEGESRPGETVGDELAAAFNQIKGMPS